MNNNEDFRHDIIDKDLYEEFEDEELLELIEEARIDAIRKAKKRNERKKPKLPFPKWTVWLIAFAMFFNVIAILPQTFSIPAVDFLITSAKLSADEQIKQYKQAVVVIETEDSKGTGFLINDRGDIITNHHVVEGEETVSVALPKLGLYQGKVEATFPEVDLAVVSINGVLEGGEVLPYLQLANNFTGEMDDSIYFIGNPLNFNGIAN